MNNLTLPPKIFKSRGCLSRAELTGYVLKQLSAKEAHDIECHLIDCPLCSDAAEGLSSAEDAEGFITATENMKFSYNTRTATKKSRYMSMNLYYTAAAVLVISLTSIWYVSTQKSPNEKLFAAFNEPYPNTIPLVRGEADDVSLEAAMVKYESGDFVSAIPIFENVLLLYPDTTEAQFYIAISYLNAGQTGKSIVYLSTVNGKSESEFSQPALWYRALAYLKEDDRYHAKEDLEALITANQKYKDKAQELLSKLESLE